MNIYNLKIQFLQEGEKKPEILLNCDFMARSYDAAKAFVHEVSELFSIKYDFVPEFYRPYESFVIPVG